MVMMMIRQWLKYFEFLFGSLKNTSPVYNVRVARFKKILATGSGMKLRGEIEGKISRVGKIKAAPGQCNSCLFEGLTVLGSLRE